MSEKETDRELELRIENAVVKQERDLLQAKPNRLSGLIRSCYMVCEGKEV